MRHILALSFIATSLTALDMTSPDGRTRVSISAGSHLMWSINRDGKPILEPSPLGVVIDGADIGQNAVPGDSKTELIDVTFPYRGNRASVRSHSMGTRISMQTGELTWVLTVRVFDNAAAFRCSVPGIGTRRIAGESTAFVLPPTTRLWFQPALHAYEGTYTEKHVEELKPGERAGPPLTCQFADGSYAAITEADLDGYSGMTLHAANAARTLNARFVCDEKGWDAPGPIETPWRVVMIAPDLDGLVNNETVACLAPAPDPTHYPEGMAATWIKPGRCVWSWLGGGGVTAKTMNDYARLASRLGYEYNLVDEGWGHWKEPNRTTWDMIAEIVRYGTRHGVETWVWKASGKRRGIPGIREREVRREFFAKCRAAGVVGVKIDFMNSESVELVDFYKRTLEDAADAELMIDFHGASKPTGETRSHPNEMTREGIRGLEARAPWARHNTILPFTRFLAGPADYTPLNFGSRRGETSWAHQLASAVVFTSPFLCLGEHPGTILANPAVEWLKTVPPTWSETRVLPFSQIGRVAGFMRRDADGNWYVAVMNGTDPRSVTIPTDRLGQAPYLAQIFADDPTRADAYLQSESLWQAGKQLQASLRPGGGFVARFSQLQLVPHAESFEDTIAVGLRKALPDETARYTLDGATPTVNSPVFGETVILNESAVLRVRVMTGPTAGAETHARYTKVRPPALQITPDARLLQEPAAITLRSGLADARIRYTVDGSEPSDASPAYVAPIPVDRDLTIRLRLTAPQLNVPILAARSYRLIPPAPPAPDIHIGELTWVSAQAGWGGKPKVNRSIEGHPLKVAGGVYAHGVGTHAKSDIVYGVAPNYARFVATVGVDEEIESSGNPSVVFQVLLDGKTIAESPVIGKSDLWRFNVTLPDGGKALTLRVTEGGDNINHDHADWINAGFVLK